MKDVLYVEQPSTNCLSLSVSSGVSRDDDLRQFKSLVIRVWVNYITGIAVLIIHQLQHINSNTTSKIPILIINSISK